MSNETLEPARQLDDRSLARVRKVSALKPGAHVHISGVCGTGTAAVLSLLKQLGFYVTGSDKAFYPPMGALVEQLADRVDRGYRAENLFGKPDLVVIGNALSRGNPEVEYVLEQGLSFASMPEVFAALLIGTREHCRHSVVVTGTHGKTTTSGILAFLLDQAGRKPAYFIGGKPKNFAQTIRPIAEDIPLEQRVVVLEGDEYDSAFFSKFSKFHSYRPDIAIVTSLEFDHADIFNSIEDIEKEFCRLVARVPKDGLILVCDACPRLADLACRWREDPEVNAEVLFYGEKKESTYCLLSRKPLRVDAQQSVGLGQQLDFRIAGHHLRIRTGLSGCHNALNLLVAAAVCSRLGLSDQDIQRGTEAFAGVERRQQIIFQQDDISVLEDFAHHPTEVRVTLDGLRETYPDKRLVAVFEPRSNTSRRSFFQEDYAGSFASADIVIILKVADAGGYQGVAKEIVALDVDRLVGEISAQESLACSLTSVEQIERTLVEQTRPGDLIVLMSNGDFGGIAQSLPTKLRERESQ